MFTPILPALSQHPPAQHQYETRIRSNSVIKPSLRLRHSPDEPHPPRRIKPLPCPHTKQSTAKILTAAPEVSLSPFPPPHVILHADDANNKVFLTIGRALMSVDNRAMTVKDLAELSLECGLMCQNMSAAGQAITTFIRNHLQRCEAQQDQPLLLRHIMSGTISDDDLVPALFSRVGGAHCTNPDGESRLTNFRRGTMVWYLSKAAGAPCPFSEAGIRLCDYNENGKVGMPINAGREKKRERDRLRKAAQSAGTKRKRLLRSSADKDSESLSDSSDDEEKRPPKVKLTLRLKPCVVFTPGAPSESAASTQLDQLETIYSDYAESEEFDSDSMSVDSDDECSSGSSLPCNFTPTVVPTYYTNLSPPPLSSFAYVAGGFRRSPSVPYSVISGSPPPDSEAEDEDFHITMTGSRRLSVGHLRPLDDDDSAWEDEFFGDCDADIETQWESPGPRSPSVQVEDQVVVKREPTDVRGLLDAWDDLENRANDMKVIDVVAQAAAAEREAEVSTSNDLASWTWPSMEGGFPQRVKQENINIETNLFFPESNPTPPPETPVVPFDPCESSIEECSRQLYGVGPSYELQWRDVEILGPDSVKLHDLEDGAWHEYRGTRAVSPEERIQSLSPEPSTAPATSPSSSSSPKLSRGALTPLDVQSTNVSAHTSQGEISSITSPSLIASLTSLCIQSPVVPASSTPSLKVAAAHTSAISLPSPSSHSAVESVVVRTVAPSTPSIFATEFEGVAVYQMNMGSSTLLRRIDTDFVNVSPILHNLNAVCPPTPDAIDVSAGSPPIRGTWVPLIVARDVAKNETLLRAFLSDDLRLLFPDSIDSLGLVGGRATISSPFGHQFRSGSEARPQTMYSHRLELPPREFEASWEDHLSTHPPFILATAAIDGHRPATEEVPALAETPLSPTEEEMFRVLCAAPEWEHAPVMQEEPSDVEDETVPPTDTSDHAQREERPLRRSKRVANAVAARSRTRSSKRGSRTSLS